MGQPKASIKKPYRLNPGDTIGVVAPAGPFDPELFLTGVTVLEALGYRVFQPEGLTLRDRFLAGPDEHRAGLINQMFADPEIKGVCCARGGYGSLRILDSIDYGLIRRFQRYQRPFMGVGKPMQPIGIPWPRHDQAGQGKC